MSEIHLCPAEQSLAWCLALVRELHLHGLEYWWISPGYRNAPMIQALTLYPGLKLYSAVDERSGAFAALGACRGLGARPTGLLVTSGTAGAHAYPALIEAYHESLPLCVVTADRPRELLLSGAQQVTFQEGLFGPFTKSTLFLPSPFQGMDLKHLRAHTALALEKALQPNHAGPLHINIPLAEPLEGPIDPSLRKIFEAARFDEDEYPSTSLKSYEPKRSGLDLATRDRIRQSYLKSQRPLVIFGRGLSNHRQEDRLRTEKILEQHQNLLTYFDMAAGFPSLKSSSSLSPSQCFRLFKDYAPDFILQLGARGVTKDFDRLLSEQKGLDFQAYALTTEESIADPMGVGFKRLRSHGLEGFFAVFEGLDPSELSQEKKLFLSEQERIKRQLLVKSEAATLNWSHLVLELREALNSRTKLFIGNSSALRAFDLWWSVSPHPSDPEVYVQRGVSGIDGHLSSALGLSALDPHAPVVVVLGDIAMIHDLNALTELKGLKQPFLVMIANDFGGGIFRRLPIGHRKDLHEPFISTPHHLSFTPMTQALGIASTQVQNSFELREVLRKFINRPAPQVIECMIHKDSGI